MHDRLGMSGGSLLGVLAMMLFGVQSPAHAAPDQLDPSFGSGGQAVLDLQAPDFEPGGSHAENYGFGLDEDAAGRLVVGTQLKPYWPSPFDSEVATSRLTPGGAFDASWAHSGTQLTDFGVPGTRWDDYPVAMATQPDGKVVVAESSGDLTLMRYDSTGALDPTFDGDGKQMLDVGTDVLGTNTTSENTSDIALAADGKIVLAGHIHDREIGYRYLVARFNEDGSLDESFSEDGVDVLTTGPDGGNSVRVLPEADGGLVIAGNTYTEGREDLADFTAVRYLEDGSLDTTFGQDGLSRVDPGEGKSKARDAALLPDGGIAMVGVYNEGDSHDDRDFITMRLNADGELDQAFGDQGRTLTDFRITPWLGEGGDEARAVTSDAQGRVIVAGVADHTPDDELAVAAYTPEGALDPTFSEDGRMLIDVNGGDDQAEEIMVDSRGRILILETITPSGGSDTAVIRLWDAAANEPEVTPECEGLRASLLGTDADDEVIGLWNGDVALGRLGNDTINGGLGDDLLCGEAGNDALEGAADADRLVGGDGNDDLTGGEGSDSLDAGPGDDSLQSGDDEIDQLSCGDGQDTAEVDPEDVTNSDCETVRLVDMDGDGVADDADQCPEVPSNEASGCPTYASHLSILFRERKGRRDALHGSIAADLPACVRDRKVVLRKVEPGRDIWVGRTWTNRDGAWKHARAYIEGRYYASTKLEVKPATGSCAGVRSEVVRSR